MKATVRDWKDHQHYRNRTPPWIKLHRALLDDPKWWSLPIASRALLPMLWLLASENGGLVEVSADFIAFRFRMSRAQAEKAVNPLLSSGWLVGASNPLATCLQPASAEGEGEGEGETEGETETEAANQTLQHCGFSDWWEELRPWFKAANRRLAYKAEALEYWKANGLAKYADQIVARAKEQRTHYQDAVRSGEKPVPPCDPHRYLKRKRYNDEMP